jgi:hypothetical protein
LTRFSNRNGREIRWLGSQRGTDLQQCCSNSSSFGGGRCCITSTEPGCFSISPYRPGCCYYLDDASSARECQLHGPNGGFDSTAGADSTPERTPQPTTVEAGLLERVQQRANMEAGLPTTSSPSEFGSRYNALFSPLNPRVSFDRFASPIGSRQQSPEWPRVFNTFPNSEPIQTPSSLPQMIVIQRPAVELLVACTYL